MNPNRRIKKILYIITPSPFLLKRRGNTSIISTSKRRKMIVIMKKTIENGLRADESCLTPHSNGWSFHINEPKPERQEIKKKTTTKTRS